jgi:DDE superfamily endonuclease
MMKLFARPSHKRTRCEACRTASLAHGGAWPQSQHRLPLEKAAAARIDAQKKSLRAVEQNRADIAKAREEWRVGQTDLNPEHLIFIDETGAKTNMVRLYGRAPRGQRLVAPVPHGHWMTTTFVAALRHDEITAPCVFDGPMDGASFLTYVKHFLTPVLHKGDIVAAWRERAMRLVRPQLFLPKAGSAHLVGATAARACTANLLIGI